MKIGIKGTTRKILQDLEKLQFSKTYKVRCSEEEDWKEKTIGYMSNSTCIDVNGNVYTDWLPIIDTTEIVFVRSLTELKKNWFRFKGSVQESNTNMYTVSASSDDAMILETFVGSEHFSAAEVQEKLEVEIDNKWYEIEIE